MKKMILAAAILAASVGSALAVDFASPMNMIDGKTPMRNEDKSIVTLGDVSENALLASFPDEQSLAGEEKMKRFALARKIHEQRKDPVLTAEEVAVAVLESVTRAVIENAPAVVVVQFTA